MKLLSLKNIAHDSKVALLEELGYGTDGIFVLDSDGNKLLDSYIEKPVKLDNMAILPGSCIIIDDNPLSIAYYIDDYGDPF